MIREILEIPFLAHSIRHPYLVGRRNLRRLLLLPWEQKEMRPPTSEECTANAIVDGRMAIWYPQMGGYVGKAWIEGNGDPEPGGCFKAYVWHDGEFPFDKDRVPARLHHCMTKQFIRFGQKVEGFIGKDPEDD